MKKLTNRKGFTLAELLIVVAIIAVLVAIAVPVFSVQLQKAELAAGTANVRAKYVEIVADKLADGDITSSGKLAVEESALEAAAGSKVTLSCADGSKITVTHAKRASLSNSFDVDADVIFE